MAKQGTKRSPGPQSAVTRATYELNQRRVRIWIPFLERKIEELQARIREKQVPAAPTDTGA